MYAAAMQTMILKPMLIATTMAKIDASTLVTPFIPTRRLWTSDFCAPAPSQQPEREFQAQRQQETKTPASLRPKRQWELHGPRGKE